MRKLSNVFSLLLILFILGFYSSLNAQNWNSLKNKASKIKVNNSSTNKTTSTVSKTNTTNTKNLTSGNVKTETTTGEVIDYDKIKKYYSNKDYLLSKIDRIWDKDLSKYDFEDLWKFDYPGTMSQMEKDKALVPDFFMVYPKRLSESNYDPMRMTHATLSQYSEFSIASSDVSPPSQSDDIVRFYQRYVQWRHNLDVSMSAVFGRANKTIVAAQNAMDKDKVDKAKFAVRYAKNVKILYPNNSMADELLEEAYLIQDQCYDDLKDIITGKMHKRHFKEIVGYTEKPIIGQENESSLTNIIEPGKPFYFVGYFADNLEKIGSKVSLDRVQVTGPPKLNWKMNNGSGTYGSQELYWNRTMLPSIKGMTYYMIDLFPELDKIAYKSHIEYIPLLNMVKWLTYQMPGEYPISFYLGKTYGAFAQGDFVIKITKENREWLKEYHKKLLAKHTAAVTFNDSYGCTAVNTSLIGGIEQTKKYGEMIKCSIKQTGTMMQPWPNEAKVDHYVGYGMAIFKKDDGRYEIMLLNFSRSPNSKTWQFHNAEILRDFEMSGSAPVQLPRLKLGYEILKENIDNCTSW